MEKTIEIPEGYEARIEGNKVIIAPIDSEDERIRKMLVKYFEFYRSHPDLTLDVNTWQGEKVSDIIAYLEKQKEQKIARWKPLGECLDIPDGHYVVGWFRFGDFRLGIMCKGLFVDPNGNRAEQPKEVFYIPNAGEEFIYAEQKPAEWSEEDERRYISCLQRLGTGNPNQPETINSKWFKEHVSPQPHWKPSEEQMNALKHCVNGWQDTADGTLESLYNDLLNLFKEL